MTATLLGPVVRLQLQTSGLKVGERGRRWYDPTPIRSLASVSLVPDGLTGWGGTATLVDAHHRDSPAGKNVNGTNAVSVLFTGHYTRMAQRFGPHLTHGIAGESVLIDTDRRIAEHDLANGLLLRGASGEDILLHDIVVAEPCVEFTRFALRRPPEERADPEFLDGFEFLRGGMRGFYARYDGPAVEIRLGAPAFLP
jgi:hypothetical protein